MVVYHRRGGFESLRRRRIGLSAGRNAASKTAEEGSIPSRPAGRSSKGKTPVSQTGDPGSSPGRSTVHESLVTKTTTRCSGEQRGLQHRSAGFDSPPGLRARLRLGARSTRRPPCCRAVSTCAMSPSSRGKDGRLSTGQRGFESRWRRRARNHTRASSCPHWWNSQRWFYESRLRTFDSSWGRKLSPVERLSTRASEARLGGSTPPREAARGDGLEPDLPDTETAGGSIPPLRTNAIARVTEWQTAPSQKRWSPSGREGSSPSSSTTNRNCNASVAEPEDATASKAGGRMAHGSSILPARTRSSLHSTTQNRKRKGGVPCRACSS